MYVRWQTHMELRIIPCNSPTYLDSPSGLCLTAVCIFIKSPVPTQNLFLVSKPLYLGKSSCWALEREPSQSSLLAILLVSPPCELYLTPEADWMMLVAKKICLWKVLSLCQHVAAPGGPTSAAGIETQFYHNLQTSEDVREPENMTSRYTLCGKKSLMIA